MLATEDKTTEQAVSSIWQLTEDRFIREEMLLRREDNEREYRYLLEQAEKAKKVDVLEKTVFEQSSKISEQERRIAELEALLAEKDMDTPVDGHNIEMILPGYLRFPCYTVHEKS